MPASIEQVIIRQARQSDLPALEWEGEFIHFRRLYYDVFQQTQRGEALMWLAELAGIGLVGQLFVQLDSQRREMADGRTRAYMHAFRVRPQYRAKGIGSLLLLNAEADLEKRGYRFICLNVGRENQGARRLYERYGYRVVAAEPGDWSYLDHHGVRQLVHEPAWRMEKDLRNKQETQ
jgi:ribosomal protein S18 acetylase RimI-like enzyme